MELMERKENKVFRVSKARRVKMDTRLSSLFKTANGTLTVQTVVLLPRVLRAIPVMVFLQSQRLRLKVWLIHTLSLIPMEIRQPLL